MLFRNITNIELNISDIVSRSSQNTSEITFDDNIYDRYVDNSYNVDNGNDDYDDEDDELDDGYDSF